MPDFSIILKLSLFALIPVVLSGIFHILRRRTNFSNVPRLTQEIIIGVVFGGVAILGTEFGVPIGGATANARDAAPLCAGLIFGPVAGITAGLIGGIERAIAVIWNPALEYSVIACSVSTTFAGIYAAILRKFMFDDKRPSWGLALATGVVMEVIHMTLLFITHINDPTDAIRIVEICTIPMVLVNSISVMLAVLVVQFMSYKIRHGEVRIRKISQQVQSWLLGSILLAYFATTLFVYQLQTSAALSETRSLMKLNIEDISTEIINNSDENELSETLLVKNHEIVTRYRFNNDVDLNALIEEFEITEINVVDKDGTIIKSTHPENLAFNMRSSEQSAAFMVLLDTDNTLEIVQEFGPIGMDSTIYRKYSAVKLDENVFIQIGYDRDAFDKNIESTVKKFTESRHIGSTGYYIILNDKNENIVADADSIYLDREAQVAINKIIGEEELTDIKTTYNKEKVFAMYKKLSSYLVVGIYPEEEAYAMRNAQVYINSFMEVLVFALFFFLIYFLIKKYVVNNIRSVNNSLSKIIGGNLDTKVDVYTSDEFSSLSDDINSTVSTLKHYIDLEAQRIDNELAFAKNIQHSALPSVFPPFPHVPEFDIFATMDTAKEVGGDFYDFYMVSENEVAFLVADVSGKGIPAALFMMTSKTLLKNMAESGKPVSEVLTDANSELSKNNEAGMFVTCWMGILNYKTGHVTFANAGHNPPLIYRKDKGFEYIKGKSGLVLGGMDGVIYRTQELDLNPGDKIYLYTDGVTEANNIEKKLYGEERLQDYLNSHSEEAMSNILKGIKSDIDEFKGDAEQFDDITMLMITYFGNKSAMIEKTFKASDAELEKVNEFIECELEKADASMKVITQIMVALEEIFVNIAHYAYAGKDGDATVGISIKDDIATIRFTDSGMPFNPLSNANPDITLSAEERSIGGLGIFMVRKTMDDVHYEYKDGKNVFTIKKRIK